MDEVEAPEKSTPSPDTASYATATTRATLNGGILRLLWLIGVLRLFGCIRAPQSTTKPGSTAETKATSGARSKAAGLPARDPAHSLRIISRQYFAGSAALRVQKITEDRCLTEIQAPNMAPFLPLGTEFPRKSGLQPDRRLDRQAAGVFTVDIWLWTTPNQRRSSDHHNLLPNRAAPDGRAANKSW